ncbi:hypothetical protein O6H91_Y205900 [Diphasiastrum complanatum]|nr:hypothetical protein O6H91_Y205900 [Diphasiastrum complanatum]
MGVVVVQLGQGGNQQGFSFFNAMANSAPFGGPLEIFFHEDVMNAANASKIWSYGRHYFTRNSGSGNNWAQGFYSHGPACRVSLLELIRLEVEACDQFCGFLLMQSMAGGTGAGLGAYLLEALRDEYPAACVMSYCIWPFETGEVVVQNYNVLLTLSHLHNHADGIIAVKNDALSSICKRSLAIEKPSFTDMNKVGAQSLASILLPAYWRPVHTGKGCSSATQLKSGSSTGWSGSGAGLSVRQLSDLVLNLCAHPGYRMLALHSTPQAGLFPTSGRYYFSEAIYTCIRINIWFHEELVDWLLATLRVLELISFLADSCRNARLYDTHMGVSAEAPKADAYDAGKCAGKDSSQNKESTSKSKNTQGHTAVGSRSVDRSVANLLVLRGWGSETVNVDMFNDLRMYPLWSVDPIKVAVHEASYGNLAMSAGLLSNSQVAILPASRVLSRAYAMYSSRAYIHHYAEHGLEYSVFDAAFASVEDILARYLAL